MESFQQALRDAQEELARIEVRRARLLQLIEDLKALSGDELPELTPPPGYEPEGLTAEVRKILSLTTSHLTAVQIRDSLTQRGFAKSSPKNLLIAVHTVLGRIEKELDVIQRDGKPAYKAKPIATMTEALQKLLDAWGRTQGQATNPAIVAATYGMPPPPAPIPAASKEKK